VGVHHPVGNSPARPWHLKRFRMVKNLKGECWRLPSGLLEDGLHILARLQPEAVCNTIIHTYNKLRPAEWHQKKWKRRTMQGLSQRNQENPCWRKRSQQSYGWPKKRKSRIKQRTEGHSPKVYLSLSPPNYRQHHKTQWSREQHVPKYTC